MATGSDAASRGSDETLSSGNEPWTEKSTRAWAIWAGGESSAAMVKGLFEVRGSRHSWRDDARRCWELSRGGLDAAEALPREPFVRLGISVEDGNARVSRFEFGGTRCCPLSFVVNHLALLPPSSSSVPGQRVTCLEAVANWKPPKLQKPNPCLRPAACRRLHIAGTDPHNAAVGASWCHGPTGAPRTFALPTKLLSVFLPLFPSRSASRRQPQRHHQSPCRLPRRRLPAPAWPP